MKEPIFPLCEVDTTGATYFGDGTPYGFATIHEIGEDKFKVSMRTSGCRSNMVDFLYRKKHNSKYEGNSEPVGEEKLDLEYTKIAWFGGVPTENFKWIKKNLKLLHKIEKAIGVEKTKVFFSPKDTGLVFIGDKVWQSALWKHSLYSYLIKCLSYIKFLEAGKYEQYLKPWRKQLLLKVVAEDREYYTGTDFQDIHNNSGFVAAVCGKANIQGPYSEYNIKMGKLLLGDNDE